MTLDKEIEQLKKKHAKKLDNEIAGLKARTLLPRELLEHAETPYVQADGEVWVTLRRHKPYGLPYAADAPKPFSLVEAVDIVSGFGNKVSNVRVSKDHCTHTQPIYNKAVGKPYWDDAEFFRWYLRVGIHNDVEFIFHVLLDDTRMRINIDLGTQLTPKLRTAEFQRWRGMQRCKATHVPAIAGAKTIKWGSAHDNNDWAQNVSVFPDDEAQFLAGIAATS